MADNSRKDKNKKDVTEEEAPVGGGRLRAARDKQKISILAIAKELHLDEQKVTALEDNRFESLGAPVFAKGHLRKYAQLVGIDDREVLADYYELTRSAGSPPVVGQRKQHRSRRVTPGPWIALVIVVVVLAFIYWTFTRGPEPTSPGPDVPEVSIEREGEEAAPTPVPVAPVPVITTDYGDADIEPPAAEESAAPSAEAEPVVESVDTPETVADTAPPAAAGQVTVALSFSEDCWTEITDSTGERLFFNLGRADSSVTVSGVPPLSVLLGSADGVSVSVNGEDYAISPADRRGRTARLTLP